MVDGVETIRMLCRCVGDARRWGWWPSIVGEDNKHVGDANTAEIDDRGDDIGDLRSVMLCHYIDDVTVL